MLHMMAFMSHWLCMVTVPSSPQLVKKSLAYLCPCHYGIPDQQDFLDFFCAHWKPTHPLLDWLWTRCSERSWTQCGTSTQMDFEEKMTRLIDSWPSRLEEIGSGIAMYSKWVVHGGLIFFVGVAKPTKRMIQIFWILVMIPCGQPLKGPRLSFWHSASLFMAPAGPVGSSEPSRFGAKLSYDRYRWHTSPFMIFRFDQIFMLPRPFDSPASFSLFDDSTLLHAQYKSWICTSCMWKRFVSKPALRFEMYAFAFLFGRAQSHKRAT